LMAVLGDGDDGVFVGVAGLDVGIVKGWRDEWLGRRDALPFCVTLTPIDGVSGEFGVGDGLPTEVNCGLGAGLVDGGDGGQAGGYGGGKDVKSFDANGRGEIAGEFLRFSVDSEADDALGTIFIGLAEANGFVEGAAGLRAGVDEQALLERLGGRGERALLGFGGGWGEQLAV